MLVHLLGVFAEFEREMIIDRVVTGMERKCSPGPVDPRYPACYTRNRYGTARCDAPRIDADAFDGRVLAALGDFYQARTDLVAEAIASAQQTYRATKRAVAAELRTVGTLTAQKETAVDRYFTDYENGKIDQGLLERRIDKLGRDLQDLRRHRDQLQLRLDTEPQHPTNLDLHTVSNRIGEIIAHGATALRRSLCEATLHKLRLDLYAATATPSLRANITIATDEPANEPHPGRPSLKGE